MLFELVAFVFLSCFAFWQFKQIIMPVVVEQTNGNRKPDFQIQDLNDQCLKPNGSCAYPMADYLYRWGLVLWSNLVNKRGLDISQTASSYLVRQQSYVQAVAILGQGDTLGHSRPNVTADIVSILSGQGHTTLSYLFGCKWPCRRLKGMMS